MDTLKKFMDILIVLFLIYAVLVLLNIISVEYLDSTFTNFSPENYYKILFGIAAGLMLISLLISNLHLLALKSERRTLNNRINELKANLYDKKVHTARDQPRENRPSNGLHNDPLFPPTNLQ